MEAVFSFRERLHSSHQMNILHKNTRINSFTTVYKNYEEQRMLFFVFS
jgi:hypothetical protein